ncbi:L-aspartate oxidase protein [Haloplasma contractile SSD-17B]|uniref:L-aspartate oxidase protein n=2 Tax=Haloplasma TaxID=471824 RepID=U2EG96_9MOLU|nr:L-aspartate oxidase protein [Haloplasma contractile SSD-17B]
MKFVVRSISGSTTTYIMNSEIREKFESFKGGKSVKGTETEKNLLKAFAGESQARNRYHLFAEQARADGYEQIAALFEETAHNEKLHAQIFFSFLEGEAVEITASYPAGKVGSTYENLIAAAEGEHEEFVELYPEFAEVAKKEGFNRIANQFRMIAKIEEQHELRYRQLAENVKEEQVFAKEEETVWVCRECGHIHTGKKVPGMCPVCLQSKAFFEVEAKNY